MRGIRSQLRIAVVTGVPAPYREPVFNELARRPGIALRVFYAAQSHNDVGWCNGTSSVCDYDHVFVPNLTPGRFQRLPLVGYANVGLGAMLGQFQPNYLIVYGYNQMFQWMAFRYATAHGVPFAIRSDSNVYLDQSRAWRSRLRRRMLRRLVDRAAAILTVGSANQAYWKAHGARSHQIFQAPYAIDNRRVANIADGRPLRSDARVRLIYAGRLIRRKAVGVLLDAFNATCDELDLSLAIVGDGPERRSLEAIQTRSARDRTHWLGKLSNDEAIREMAESDLFVLPSRYEPWGLVVNEAMAAGLPVVAHRHCGAAIDLIEPGRTGWIVGEITRNSLIDVIRQAAADPERLAEMGDWARERIQKWSIRATVDGMLSAVRSALPDPWTVKEEPAHV